MSDDVINSKHGEMQLRIQNIRPIFPAPLMITSILCKNTPKWGDFIYTPQSPHFGMISGSESSHAGHSRVKAVIENGAKIVLNRVVLFRLMFLLSLRSHESKRNQFFTDGIHRK